MQKNMENDMETGFAQGFGELGLSMHISKHLRARSL